MDFLTKLRDVGSEVKRLKESFTVSDPRKPGFSQDYERDGFSRLQPRRDARWEEAVRECAALLADVKTGRRPAYHLREAMTTADFPNLFGDVLYRQLLGNYQPYPVTYPSYFRIMDAPDFRVLHMYAIDGGQGLLATDGKSAPQSIKEREPYPETKFVETPYTVQVLKYGRRYGVTFEMMVNDDLNAFQSRPSMMATGARRTEEYLATSMLCTAAGPDPNFFKAGNKNIVDATYGPNPNPPLSIGGLQQAYAQLSAQLDKDGQPIVIDMVSLVVPPALKVTAENILKSADLRIMTPPAGALPTGGDLGSFIYGANWMQGKLRLSVNPYLPYINTTNGNTAWYMIADPNDQTQRPAFVFAFLRGRRTPQLFMKDPDQRMLGGGVADPMDGSFDSDSIDYKLRHIMGVAQVDPVMAIASNGTGN